MGLYIHNTGWCDIPYSAKGVADSAEAQVRRGLVHFSNDDKRKAILQTFQETGPQAVVLGTVGPQYWDLYYKKLYTNLGVHADQAHVNISNRARTEFAKSGIARWQEFVDKGRTCGLKVIAPIFAPNSGQWKTDNFSSSKFDYLRNMAKYGGGLTIDAPPNYFLLENPKGYQSFVEDEIRWARARNILATWIISPHRAGSQFLPLTQQLIAKLKKDNALPNLYVVQCYPALPLPANFTNVVGSENTPDTVNNVALWVAENAPVAPGPVLKK